MSRSYNPETLLRCILLQVSKVNWKCTQESSCADDNFQARTSHKGVSGSISVHDIVLVDVHNREHGHPLTCGGDT